MAGTVVLHSGYARESLGKLKTVPSTQVRPDQHRSVLGLRSSPWRVWERLMEEGVFVFSPEGCVLGREWSLEREEAEAWV